GIALIDVFQLLRQHIVLILIITLLFAAGGFAYSRLRKPVYTATVPVQFDVTIKSFDEHGLETENDNQVASTNYLFAYIDSAAGICKSGEVIDRANVYYNYFLFQSKNGKNIDDFMREIYTAYQEVKATRGEIPGYEVTEDAIMKCRNKWFTSDNVGANSSSSGTGSEVAVNFSLWVKNLNSTQARIMARIYAFAADVALNQILVFDNGTAGLIDLAGTYYGVSLSPDMSTTKVVIAAVIIGLALALATVFIMNFADNTVKSKEQLEKMSGASVIAYIDDVAEVR
ncbi:MAG: hypothetical protein J5781_03730, partial [Clostridia bacterium]|nr:hypothetical protein [Clostridia bacterium]